MSQLQMPRMICRIIMGCLLLLAPARAGADPIVIGITGGFLDMIAGPPEFHGLLMLSGEHGFTLSSGVEASGGNFLPSEQCNVLPRCAPGDSLNLRGFWAGTGVISDITLDGVTYTHVGGFESPYGISVEFAGVATLPPIADSATVVAPFTFNGFFGDDVTDALEGLGTTTLSLVRSGENPDRWRVSEARYDFAPTPEPASLLLVTAGLAGAVLRFRTRQPRRRT